jgi:hypothetical protein
MSYTNKALLFFLAVSITINISLASLVAKKIEQIKDADAHIEYIKDQCSQLLRQC